LYDAAGEACMEVIYPGGHKGQVVSSLCPPCVGVWFESVDYHKGSCSATGCLWHVVTPKNMRSCIPDTLPALLLGRLPSGFCPPVSTIIKTKRLRFFGHVARSDSRQDHHHVSASFRSQRDWRRPRGRPRTT